MLRRKALVLSPFATTPLDAGQRKRVHQTTKILKELGFEIVFLLYAFEDGWKLKANEDWLDEMKALWDEVIVLRANPNVGMPAQHGSIHWLDEWWHDVLEIHLREIFAYRHFEVFVVHNVWLSKAFDFVPRGTVRILDTHDVFSTRLPYFEQTRTIPEFFATDAQGESLGCNRADIVLAIQENDALWFERNTSSLPITLPYCVNDQPELALFTRNNYLHKDKVIFGFLGSAHIFNIRGLSDYCAELAKVVGYTAAPVEFLIGGKVGQTITTTGPWVLCGGVANEDEFLTKVDVVVVPVFDGSGFKVKIADAAARSMPIIAASHAAIGMNFDRSVIAADAKELARMTANIALHRPKYEELQDITRAAYRDLLVRHSRGVKKLDRKISTWQSAILYDLTGLSIEQASCVLLTWSGAFHLAQFAARQLVVAPEQFREALANLVPTGVFLISEDEVGKYSSQVWQWITVKNINPTKWCAHRDKIKIDAQWINCFDDGHPAGNENIQEIAGRTAFFWHNVNWGPVPDAIVKLAAHRNTQERFTESAEANETIIVARPAQVSLLKRSTAALFPGIGVATVDSFDGFFDLLLRVASKQISRLVVMEADFPVRVHVLRELCGVRGIEFVGVSHEGAVSSGYLRDDEIKRKYQLFERYWRLRNKNPSLASSDQGADDQGPEPLLYHSLEVVSPSFVDNFTFSASSKTVPKNNLYYLEYDSEANPYRWTGPDRASRVSVFLERAVLLQLEVNFLYFQDLARQMPLKVFVDGLEVEHSFSEIASGRFVLRATIPVRGEASCVPTEICFVVNEVMIASATDARQVGAAFSGLRVFPLQRPENQCGLSPEEVISQEAIPLAEER